MHHRHGFLKARASFFACSLVAVLLAGCPAGSSRDAGTVPVTGKVTYNGQGVEGATVTFAAEGMTAPGAAMTGSDGSYTLRAKPGKYTITVSKFDAPTNTQDVSMQQ